MTDLKPCYGNWQMQNQNSKVEYNLESGKVESDHTDNKTADGYANENVSTGVSSVTTGMGRGVKLQ